MTDRALRFISMVAAFAGGVPGCTKDFPVPESTTTDVAVDRDVTAVSADGMLELFIPAGALSARTDVIIATRRDVRAAGVVGLVYEVLPANLSFAEDGELRIKIPEDASEPNYSIAAISPGNVGRISGAKYFPAGGVVRATVAGLAKPYYAAAAAVVAPPPPPPNMIDGWDAAPATGRVFVIDNLAVTPADRGFDLDGRCGPTTCVDNALAGLGDLGNDQIRQGLVGGEWLNLIELAGLDEPYNGSDASLAVKLYSASDADDPFFPANNFDVPPGHTTCCEFEISPTSIAGIPPQARSRAPADITAGRLVTLSETRMPFPFIIAEQSTLAVEYVLMSMRLASDLSEITDGLIGGVLTINGLAGASNPYCQTVSPLCPVQFTDSTMIDFITTLITPLVDIDLDGDGLETLTDSDGDGRIDVCLDGCIGACTTPAVVPPIDPSDPTTCTLAPQMADGFSIGLHFTAVPATVVLSP